MKPTSLKEVSLFSALIIAAFGLTTMLLLKVLGVFIPLWLIILAALLIMAVSYATVYFMMDKFIYSRIKILYKVMNISQSKNPQLENLVSDDIIKDVEQQVKNYTITKTAEINELKKMEQYRKEFLGDVSHELKTPIFNTQGYIETLLEGAINDQNINKSYLIKASKNLDRLNSIVEDLVTISMHETHNTKLSMEKFDVVALIKDVYEDQEMTADLKDIELKFKKDIPNAVNVIADKKSIKTVLNNLVNNAIKYGKEDGKVIAAIYDIHDNILVEITDNGPGIAEEHLPRLFDRFFRIDKHRSRFDGGNGLGLAICKHIMETHQQTIQVRSSLNEGTTFSITLSKAK